MVVNVKINIGRKKIPKNLDPTLANYTRQVRDQTRAIVEDLKFFYAQLEDVTPEILKDALKPVFEESQRVVPVDTRKLKLSGYLEARADPKGGTVEIGYARAGQPEYAVIVHENMDFFHDPPTKSKFLEGPLNEMFFEVQRSIIDSYGTATKGKK